MLARFSSGAIGTIRAVPLAYHAYSYAIELHGTAGSLVVSPRTLKGATGDDRDLIVLDVPAAGVSEQVAHTTCFIEAIRAGGPSPDPSFDDGVATQAVMAACAESVETGQWISVNA